VTGSPRSPRPPSANKVTKLGKGKYDNLPATIVNNRLGRQIGTYRHKPRGILTTDIQRLAVRAQNHGAPTTPAILSVQAAMLKK
jgi:hypothetical protein